MSGLLDPLQVGRITLRNRIVMPPMVWEVRGLSAVHGEVTEGLINYYSSRAEDLGLQIIEASYVNHEGKMFERQLGIYDDTLIHGLRRLVNAIHTKKTPVVIQLYHAGRVAKKEMSGMDPVGPSEIIFDDGRHVRALEIEEMGRIKEDFVNAARRAFEVGFDGVEIHGAHEYLLQQFLSPISNKRTDIYGGSLENRMRFPLKIAGAVRSRFSDHLVLYRLGADDMMPGGFTIEEAKIFARRLEQIGIDILDISGGLCGGMPPQLQGKQGFFVPLAEEVKKNTKVPVIGVGGINDPHFADKLVREGRVDLVAVGRAMLRDPNWSKKAKEELSKTSLG